MDGVMFMHHDRLAKMQMHIWDRQTFGQILRVSSAFSFKGDEKFLNGGDIRTRIDGDPLGCVGDLGWYCVRLGLFAFQYETPKYVKAIVHRSTFDGVPLDVNVEVYFEDQQDVGTR